MCGLTLIQECMRTERNDSHCLRYMLLAMMLNDGIDTASTHHELERNRVLQIKMKYWI